MSLSDFNRVLYRCDEEERDEGWGGGAYDFVGFRKAYYCGFMGKSLVTLSVSKRASVLVSNRFYPTGIICA